MILGEKIEKYWESENRKRKSSIQGFEIMYTTELDFRGKKGIFEIF